MPKVSVIIPIYNVEKYLRRCLDSVLAQTFTDIEIICINDGSTDGSAAILEEYAGKDSRIKIVNQENQGLSITRNKGLEIAVGEYIAFADSDDFYAPAFLQTLLNTMEQTGADIVGCDFQKIYKKTDTLGQIHKIEPKIYPNALDVLLHPKNFIHFNVWNKLYKRDVIGDIRFVPHIYYEDWVFNCCVFERAQRFAWIKEKLYAYRISNTSIMRSDFNVQKLNDYVIGIKEVHNYFVAYAPEKWEKIRQTRISRTVKMMMNSALRSKNNNLIQTTAQALKKLKSEELITYTGLSIANKIKLFRFLCYYLCYRS